jgi:hypothetical protein
VIVTNVPGFPLTGLKLEITGLEIGFGFCFAVTVKLLALVAFPSVPLSTVIGPVIAPAGTVVVISVAVLFGPSGFAGVVAGTLPNATVAPMRLLPTIVTNVPTAPLVGLKLVMTGAAEARFGAATPEAARSIASKNNSPTLAPLRNHFNLSMIFLLPHLVGVFCAFSKDRVANRPSSAESSERDGLVYRTACTSSIFVRGTPLISCQLVPVS